MQIGKDLITAGSILSLFGGTFAQVGAVLVQAGTVLAAGAGSAGPIRVGNEGVTISVAPWQA